jgi:hypothetical protein
MNRGPGNSGLVDEDDYATWRANFGMTSGGGSSASGTANIPVPEPGALLLMTCGTVAFVGLRRSFQVRRQITLDG